jgi:hypothetical protein
VCLKIAPNASLAVVHHPRCHHHHQNCKPILYVSIAAFDTAVAVHPWFPQRQVLVGYFIMFCSMQQLLFSTSFITFRWSLKLSVSSPVVRWLAACAAVVSKSENQYRKILRFRFRLALFSLRTGIYWPSMHYFLLHCCLLFPRFSDSHIVGWYRQGGKMQDVFQPKMIVMNQRMATNNLMKIGMVPRTLFVTKAYIVPEHYAIQV